MDATSTRGHFRIKIHFLHVTDIPPDLAAQMAHYGEDVYVFPEDYKVTAFAPHLAIVANDFSLSLAFAGISHTLEYIAEVGI